MWLITNLFGLLAGGDQVPAPRVLSRIQIWVGGRLADVNVPRCILYPPRCHINLRLESWLAEASGDRSVPVCSLGDAYSPAALGPADSK